MQGRLKQFSEDVDIMCVEKNKYDIVDKAALLWKILHFVILEYKSKYPWFFVKYEDIAAAPSQGRPSRVRKVSRLYTHFPNIPVNEPRFRRMPPLLQPCRRRVSPSNSGPLLAR